MALGAVGSRAWYRCCGAACAGELFVRDSGSVARGDGRRWMCVGEGVLSLLLQERILWGR